MASTNFTDQITKIQTSWLQTVNNLFYRVFDTPSTIEDVVNILPEATQSSNGLVDNLDQIKLNDIDSPFSIPNFEVEVVTSSRNLVFSDRFKYLRANSSSDITFTIPTNSNQPFSTGDFIFLEQTGTGTVTISTESGVTLNSAGNTTTSGQYAVIAVIKTLENEWSFIGEVIESAGGILIFSSRDVLTVYDATTFGVLTPPSQQTSGVSEADFSPDNSRLAVIGSTTTGFRQYSLPDFTVIADPVTPPTVIEGGSVDYSPDGSLLAVHDTVYNTSDMSVAFTISLATFANVDALDFSPDGSMLAVGVTGEVSYVEIYNTSDWSLISGTPNPPSLDELYSVSFSPDGTKLAISAGSSSSSSRLSIYNVSDWSLNVVPDFPNRPPNADTTKIQWHPSGSHLLVPNEDDPNLILYRASDLVPLSFPGLSQSVSAASFNSDGSIIALSLQSFSATAALYSFPGLVRLPDPSPLPPSNPFFCRFSN